MPRELLHEKHLLCVGTLFLFGFQGFYLPLNISKTQLTFITGE